MPREALNPPTLMSSQPYGYSQVITTTGTRTIHCAGQTSIDREGNILAPGDAVGQIAKALDNCRLALEEAGAAPKDVARMTIYLVDHDPANMEALSKLLHAFFGDVPPAANSVIGVQRLAIPGLLAEIEVTAVLD